MRNGKHFPKRIFRSYQGESIALVGDVQNYIDRPGLVAMGDFNEAYFCRRLSTHYKVNETAENPDFCQVHPVLDNLLSNLE